MTLKKITFAMLWTMGLLPAAAQTQPGNEPTTEESGYVPEGYHLDWADEFDNGTELNSTDWTHEVQNSGWVNHELQNYVNHTTPKGEWVTTIRDGALVIRALKENGKVYSGRVYAHVRQGWTYGYIEARIKLPKGKGTWPAFWMMPVHFTGWPKDGEIDIMEEVGYNPNYVSSSLHATAHVHSNGTQVTHEMLCPGAEDEYHIYGIEWTGQKITTFVDGKKQLEYANRGLGRDDWPYDDPFYVILNLAWGGDWGGSQGVDESALPVEMQVDYVRVYQNGKENPEPGDDLKIGDIALEKKAVRIYTATGDFEQGKDYAATGDDRLSDTDWYYDPDFFTRNEDGTYKFNAVSGKYQVTANFYSNFFKIIPLDGNGDWLTFDKVTGTGALWMMGDTNEGKPSTAFAGNWGASNGWNPTPDMFFPVPQVGDHTFQLTMTAGEQISTDAANFKLYHQAGYGTEPDDQYTIKEGAPYQYSIVSDLFRIMDSGTDLGNIQLQGGKTLTEGTTYVFTLDCSDPKNAMLTVTEGTPTAIRNISRETAGSHELYDLQGRKVSGSAYKKGIYIQDGRKIIRK